MERYNDYLIKPKFQGRCRESRHKGRKRLDTNQTGIVAVAKRDGKVAFVKKGKLIVGPRRPDSRTYAQIAADVTGVTAEGSSTLELSAGRVNARGQMPRGDRQRDGDSPRAKQLGRGV